MAMTILMILLYLLEMLICDDYVLLCLLMVLDSSSHLFLEMFHDFFLNASLQLYEYRQLHDIRFLKRVASVARALHLRIQWPCFVAWWATR